MDILRFGGTTKKIPRHTSVSLVCGGTPVEKTALEGHICNPALILLSLVTGSYLCFFIYFYFNLLSSSFHFGLPAVLNFVMSFLFILSDIRCFSRDCRCISAHNPGSKLPE